MNFNKLDVFERMNKIINYQFSKKWFFYNVYKTDNHK